ncbi:MAG: glycine--tRNA ligase subunit beta, partial [Hyphomonas sp.]|nr:glycine--tRNA ligase subunit beta [Hyphomonas sp.]
MAELLLELFSEEIPARMQAKAEADLRDAMEKALGEAGLEWKLLAACSGPRRLTVSIDGLSERSADVKEERKGPKVGAPDKAVEGFLRGAGLKDISEAEVRADPKKGDFYVAVIETPGREARDIIAEAVPAIIRGFHWPKSMRWASGDLRWVRPLQRITCVLDGKTVPFDVDGIASGNEVEGHRVHGRGPYTVTGWKDYKHSLEQAGHVKLTRAERREVILAGIKKVCSGAKLEWIEDQGLLEEVTGLAEWPVVVLGDMDPDFLSLPPEVIQLSMRTHQKYFAVNDKKTGKLAPNFIVVANIEAADGGKKIAEGNARVLSARLEDARFFWEKDKATPLEEMA